LAVVASRSFLAGALLRSVTPARRRSVVDFLRGLSLDELECLADFEGACTLEATTLPSSSPYRILSSYFNPTSNERWHNPDDCAHKTFIALAWLELRTASSVRITAISTTA
jgi:hypothetical protein